MESKNNKTESMQLRLTPKMLDFIRRTSAQHDMSAPEFIRWLVKKFEQKVTKRYQNFSK